MNTRPVKYPELCLILPPVLFGPVQYYAAIAAAGNSVTDYEMPADKRFKSAHRYTIADTRGPVSLTVPVSHLGGRRSWNEVEISAHGQWWKNHITALESAYSRTPFFEYYIDRLRPLFQEPGHEPVSTVGALVQAADCEVRKILGLPGPLSVRPSVVRTEDLRGELPGVRENAEPYWQVRADKLGFIAGLSILDLIFNLGPEAALYLHSYPWA
ncbi:MAG: WbqC family protein [Muribaculaceae bacterium]|nr:WbqC family protein [Muribaculaceae bacterium]